jgi:NAD(P)-dependent dehydrogenase (short-subunit alcohol dehydrogenase family)
MTRRDTARQIAYGDRLRGKVAVVTGASRGVGRGIAEELGAQGATVYVTGRSTRAADAPEMLGERLPGTIAETADAVSRLGGTGVPVAVDQGDDEQVAALFERVAAEAGRLDVLVNNAFTNPEQLLQGGPFWELPVSLWDDLVHVGVRSSYVAAVHAARLMVPNAHGLIVNTSGPGGRHFMYTTAYGVGKTAVDRMASDMALELRPHGVAVLSLWLGRMRTERSELASKNLADFDLAGSESTRFPGRAVAALAGDPEVLDKSGATHYVAELAEAYGFTDVDGAQVASRRPRFGEPPAFNR